MTSISSYLPYISGTNSPYSVSSDSLLLDQLTSSNTQQTSSSGFGNAVSLNLSDNALSFLSGDDSSGNDSASGILDMLTYSNYSGNTSSDNSADSLLSSLGLSSGSTPGTSDINSATEDMLESGGPLPAFLKMVDAQMHLNTTQQQALQDIAMENMDATNTPDTVQKIAGELQEAGI